MVSFKSYPSWLHQALFQAPYDFNSFATVMNIVKADMGFGSVSKFTAVFFTISRRVLAVSSRRLSYIIAICESQGVKYFRILISSPVLGIVQDIVLYLYSGRLSIGAPGYALIIGVTLAWQSFKMKRVATLIVWINSSTVDSGTHKIMLNQRIQANIQHSI